MHESAAPQQSTAGGIDALSPRERQVLDRVARGETNVQVASDLSVSVHAVKFHLASIYRKLGVTNRTEAVVALLGARLLEPRMEQDGG